MRAIGLFRLGEDSERLLSAWTGLSFVRLAVIPPAGTARPFCGRPESVIHPSSVNVRYYRKPPLELAKANNQQRAHYPSWGSAEGQSEAIILAV